MLSRPTRQLQPAIRQPRHLDRDRFCNFSQGIYMKVLVLSDVHDHIEKLQKVIEAVSGKIETVIFCGDLVSPYTAGLLAKFDLPTYACLGNNDEDQIGLVKRSGSKVSWTHLSQEFGQVELSGRKAALCHYPKLAELLAKTGSYDAVFYGHTHVAQNEKIGQTLLLNPGAVCGINFDSGQYDPGTYAIYESITNMAEVFSLT